MLWYDYTSLFSLSNWMKYNRKITVELRCLHLVKSTNRIVYFLIISTNRRLIFTINQIGLNLKVLRLKRVNWVT